MNNEKIAEVLKYCLPYVNQMWSANIIAILLGCDFRDSEQEAAEFLDIYEQSTPY